MGSNFDDTSPLSHREREVLEARYGKRRADGKKRGKKGKKCGKGWISADKDCDPSAPKKGRKRKLSSGGEIPAAAALGNAIGVYAGAASAIGAGAYVAAKSRGKTTAAPSPPLSEPRRYFPPGIDLGTDLPYPSWREGDHPDTAKVIQQAEDEIRGKNVEWAISINARTGKIIDKRTDNKDSSVGFDVGLIGSPENIGDVIVTHNHPDHKVSSGIAPLSPADMALGASTPVREIRACTKESGTYSLSAPPGRVKGEDEDAVVKELDRISEKRHKDFLLRILERLRPSRGETTPYKQMEREESTTMALEIAADFIETRKSLGYRYTVLDQGRKDSALVGFPPVDDRIFSMVFYSPVCSNCKNFRGLDMDIQAEPGLDGPRQTCNAFPYKIPDEIWDGENPHTAPYPGDNGIRFEAQD